MAAPDPTALIAEDEPLLDQSLQAELARLWPQLRIVAGVGDGASAVMQALALRPDICFLDIRMPGMTGLEAARAMAEDWPGEAAAAFPLLVFVTAYDQYALQAFDVQAVDYLVKPVDQARLAECVCRLKRRMAMLLAERAASSSLSAPSPATASEAALQQTMAQLRALLGAQAPVSTPLEVIQASVGDLVHMVPVSEVLYFEAADKYVRVVTADHEHLIRMSLRDLLPQLDAQRFWQVHRGLVVQARTIVSALRDDSGKVFLTLRGRPERLTASRMYAHLFKGM